MRQAIYGRHANSVVFLSTTSPIVPIVPECLLSDPEISRMYA